MLFSVHDKFNSDIVEYSEGGRGGARGARGAMAPPIFSSASPRNFSQYKKRSLDLKVRLVDKV